MSEQTDAYALAERLLDEPSCDPDDDLRMLARQLLRHKDVVEQQKKALQEVDWNDRAQLDLIHANRDQILKIHQEGLSRIRKVLGNAGGLHLVDQIKAILHAINTFHPMHGESWGGWPEGT